MRPSTCPSWRSRSKTRTSSSAGSAARIVPQARRGGRPAEAAPQVRRHRRPRTRQGAGRRRPRRADRRDAGAGGLRPGRQGRRPRPGEAGRQGRRGVPRLRPEGARGHRRGQQDGPAGSRRGLQDHGPPRPRPRRSGWSACSPSSPSLTSRIWRSWRAIPTRRSANKRGRPSSASSRNETRFSQPDRRMPREPEGGVRRERPPLFSLRFRLEPSRNFALLTLPAPSPV